MRSLTLTARPKHCCGLVRIAVLVAVLCCQSVSEAALPQGRAWSVRDTLRVPGHTRGFGPFVIWPDHGDSLLLVGRALGGIGEDLVGLAWRDSVWSVRWNLGAGIATAEPGVALSGRRPLVWRPLAAQGWLVYSEDWNGAIAAPETVTALNSAGTVEYAAATAQRRRWVSVHDSPGGLRLFFSDTAFVWHETFVSASASLGTSLAPLNDSTVLVAAASGAEPRLVTGVLRGSTWGLISPPETFDTSVLRPRLRLLPSGGVLCVWATNDSSMAFSVLDGATWSPTQRVSFHLASGAQTFSKECKVSLDGASLPIISWVADNVATFGGTPFVAVPLNQTYLEPEQLATTEDVLFLFAAPDRNADVWIGWWGSNRGMIWTHTYTRAIASSPTIAANGATRVLNWSLSEAAPGSWWSVLRARGMDPFEDIGRLQAGTNLSMSWIDASPPAGILRYQIRREHVDARYRWLSEVAQWPTGAQAPMRWGRIRLPLADTSSIDLLGAAPGTTRLTMHDLFGRVVGRAEQHAGGTGRDVFALGQLARDSKLPAGIYLLRAVDSSGAISVAAKIVLLH